MIKREIQRESSPIAQDLPMSPNTRRRAEFTIKQLQNGVIGRARSTLNSLGDVWRPKSVSSSPLKHQPSAGANRTLDFLLAWSRQKKMANTTKVKLRTAVSDENIPQQLRKIGSPARDFIKASGLPTKLFARNKDRLNPNNVLIESNMNKNKTFARSMIITDELMNENNNSPMISEPLPVPRRLSRNLSLEMEFAVNALNVPMISGSYDDDTTILNNVYTNRRNSCIGKYVPENPTKTSFTKTETKPKSKDTVIVNKSRRTAADDKSANTNGKGSVSDDAKENVIKARLKLKKYKITEDTILQTGKPKEIVFHRHNSAEPKMLMTDTDNSLEKLLTNERDEFEEKLNELLGAKQRRKVAPEKIHSNKKKLSFRDPIVAPKCVNFKSDSLPTANRFLDDYERKRTSSFDLELEVIYYFCYCLKYMLKYSMR